MYRVRLLSPSSTPSEPIRTGPAGWCASVSLASTAGSSRLACAQRLQAAAVQRPRERGLGIAAVCRQLGVQRALQLDLLVDGQPPAIDEPVGDRYRRLARDRGAGLGQQVGVDRPFLKREHAEEQIAVGIHDDLTSEERTSPCSRAIGGPANAASRSGVFRRPADGTMRPG